MVTLRSYPDLIDASLAKSALEVNGIHCSLADENANTNTMAKFAIPGSAACGRRASRGRKQNSRCTPDQQPQENLLER